MRVLFFLLAGLSALSQPGALHAAAWTLDKGKIEIIHNFTYYTASSFHDPQGNRRAASRFKKIEYNPYIQYGLSDATTLGISPSFQHLGLDNASGTRNETGLSDTEIFLRRRLWRSGGQVFSIQPLIKIPGPYGDDNTPQLGNGQSDLELRGLWGYGFSYGGQNHFANLEGAYRRRAGAPGDEMRFDATLGLRPRTDFLVMAQSFNTLALDKPASASFIAANAADYNLSKLQLSMVKQLSSGHSLQGGAFKNIWAENSGGGGGLLIALWSEF